MTQDAYTAHELAARWKMSVNHIYRMLGTKAIQGFRVGGAWRVSAEEVSRIEAGKPVSVDNPNYVNPFDRLLK